MDIGRIKRSTFIIISLVIVGIYVYFYFFNEVIISEVTGGLLVFHIIMALIVIVLIAGRLNDINVSGWFSLLALIPFLNFIFFALYFIDGTVGDNKYGKDPKGRINNKLPKTQTTAQYHSHSIKEIERKLQLIKESYEMGVLNDREYENKKNELLIETNTLRKNRALEKEFILKKQKIITLFENNIISKEELDLKLKKLKKTYNNTETDFEITNLDANHYYYISRGKEYGPTTAKSIIDLIKNKTIKPETYIRYENEKLYSRQANDILDYFE